MPNTPNSSFTARCLLQRLDLVIAAIERHPKFDRSDPRNSYHTLYCLWDFNHRSRHQLEQIDFRALDDEDEEALERFDEIIERACLAHGMLTDESGLLVAGVIGGSTTPIDLGDEIRGIGALLFPDPRTGEFTKDPEDQNNKSTVDLNKILDKAKISDDESEGEWEEGADDSEWEDVGPELPPDNPERCIFLELPRELRDNIYKYLLCTDYTKRQSIGLIFHKPLQYKWRLQTVILRANKQIYGEAREVLGRENRFVVIERATDRLRHTVDGELDRGGIAIPNALIWPGRAKSQVSVPGEVMRINFSKPEEDEMIDYFVFLAEELWDFFIHLGTYMTGGVYCTEGLACSVTLGSSKESETKSITKRRESALLDPLTKLRCLSRVTINGASKGKTQNTSQQMRRNIFSAADVVKTTEEILVTIDAYANLGNHTIAVSYCDWAKNIIDFNQQAQQTIQAEKVTEEQTGSYLLRISLKRALACINSGHFEDAYDSADIALSLAMKVAGIPKLSDFPHPANGLVNRGRLLEWTTKTTVARCGGSPPSARIAAEDVARAYWYRALAEVCHEGPNCNEETDRLLAISLANYVGKKDVSNEMCTLELDLMHKLREKTGEKWNGLKGKSKPFGYSGRCRDLPSYNRAWERPLPPAVPSKNKVTDGGMAFMLSRVDLRPRVSPFPS